MSISLDALELIEDARKLEAKANEFAKTHGINDFAAFAETISDGVHDSSLQFLADSEPEEERSDYEEHNTNYRASRGC